jgi:hypothetical protein
LLSGSARTQGLTHLLAPSPDSCLHLMVESLGNPAPPISHSVKSSTTKYQLDQQ